LDCTDPGFATLPDGWTERLVPFRTPRTGGVTAWCLEPHDLFASKLAAWRNKDGQFLTAMLRHELVEPKIIVSRIEDLPVANSARTEMKGLLAQLVRVKRLEMRKRHR
jgi:hypothetical protein